MKNLKVLLAVLAVLVMIGVSACQKETTAPTTTDTYEQPEFFLPNVVSDLSTLPSDVTEPTMETDMTQVIPNDAQIVRPPMDKGRLLPPNHPFAKILRALQLTPDQAEQIKAFLKEHRDCVEAALKALRESERAIIQPANAERKALALQYKNGEITKEELISALKDLRQRTKEALVNNPQRQIALQAMIDCEKALFTSIYSILTPEQQTKWDEWMARYKEMLEKRKNG
jgi:Spy/CpxP family protein refolding chaperone